MVWWNGTDYSDPTDDPFRSIVRCTARVTDTLTIVQPALGNNYNGEGTTNTATNHNISGKQYKMALCLTSKMIDDLAANVGPTGYTGYT